jgi:heme-degrading monooxygenase HmoA
MHIQIINFQLNGISEEEYSNLCDQLAPAVAQLPGLVSKVWLANSDTNTYGGVYTWRDRQAMENFTKTDLFKSVATHPGLANITSKDFSVMPGPTRITQGLVRELAASGGF